MPDLSTELHIDTYRRIRALHRWWPRVRRAWNALTDREYVYGLEWGDPEYCAPLQYVRDKFLLPYLSADAVVVEIGPGGGRWTRYMVGVKRLYAVDYHQEMIEELSRNFDLPNIELVRTSGTDLPGVPERSVDFIFSFGTFVHLDLELIDAYLASQKEVLKPEGCAVINYSDYTKPMARQNWKFGRNEPRTMRRLLLRHGYRILEEDTKTLWHSSLIRYTLA